VTVPLFAACDARLVQTRDSITIRLEILVPRVVIRLRTALLVAFVGGTAAAGWGLAPFGGCGNSHDKSRSSTFRFTARAFRSSLATWTARAPARRDEPLKPAVVGTMRLLSKLSMGCHRSEKDEHRYRKPPEDRSSRIREQESPDRHKTRAVEPTTLSAF
jgi:hypothetical protein